MNDRPSIVVTGAQGFIGKHLVERLSGEYPQHLIVGVDREKSAARESHPSNVTMVLSDTRDIRSPSIRCRLGSPAAIVHLGEFSRIHHSFENVEAVWASNISGTHEVIRLAMEADSPLLYAASSSTWSDHGPGGSPYTWAKTVNAEYIRNCGRWFGLTYSISYLSCVYGHGQKATGDSASVMGVFEKAVLDGIPLPVVRPGTQRRNYTHIDDTVDGLLLALTNIGAVDEVAFVSDDDYTVINLAELYRCNWEFVGERPGDRSVTNVPERYRRRASQIGWKARRRVTDYVSSFLSQTAAGGRQSRANRTASE